MNIRERKRINNFVSKLLSSSTHKASLFILSLYVYILSEVVLTN